MTIENDPKEKEGEQEFTRHEDNVDLIGSNGFRKDNLDFNEDRPSGPDDGDLLG